MINHTHVCCWCSQNGEMFILHVTSYVDHLLPQFRVPNVDGSIFRFSHVSGEETSIVLYDNVYIYSIYMYIMDLHMIVQDWRPPVISWFINPMNYSYTSIHI